MNQNLLSNKDSYDQSLKELYRIFKKKITVNEDVQIDEFQKEKKENKCYEHNDEQIIEHKENNNKMVSDADETGYQFMTEQTDKQYEDATQANRDGLENKIKFTSEEVALEDKRQIYCAQVENWTDKGKWYNEQSLDEKYKEEIKSANLTYEESYEQTIKEHKEKYSKIVTDAETEYHRTKLKINEEYQDTIQASNDDLENTIKLATQKLEVTLKANENTYSARVRSHWFESKRAEVQEDWATADVEAKRIKTENEKSARADNITAHKRAQTTRDRKLNKAWEVKQSKKAIAETDMSQNLLLIKESYKQSLDKIIKDEIKSAGDSFRENMQQNKVERQEIKKEKIESYEQNIKELNENYNKRVSDAETEYQFTKDKIYKEYQDAVQASDDELENMLTLATKTLEAALEANEKIYSAKVKACWTEKGKVEVHKIWSGKVAEEKRLKIEIEKTAVTQNLRAHKTAQDTRDKKINTAWEDKQSKIVNAETDKSQKLLLIKKSYKQSLEELDKSFKEKMKSAQDTYEVKMKQNEEDFQETKQAKDKLYEQKSKKVQETYDNKVSDIEKEYQFTEENISKEYENAIQVSNNELENMLTLATQKLETALKANEKIYATKLKSWTDKGKFELHEEWAEKDSENKKTKHESDNSARADNIAAHKLAQQIRDRELNKALEDKQSKLQKAETDMNQNLLSIKESYENTVQELHKTFTEKVKSADDICKKQKKHTEKELQEAELQSKISYEQTRKEHEDNYDKIISDAKNEYQLTKEKIKKEYQDTKQASNDELGNMLTIATQNLEAALAANKQIYTAKVIAWTDRVKPDISEEWSKKDADEKRNRSDSEKSAKSENIKAHKLAQETRESKLNEAFKYKKSAIEQAEKNKTLKIENALETKKNVSNKILETKSNKNAAAKSEKDKAIHNAQKEKEDAEQKAKDRKENDDKIADNIKSKKDNTSKQNMDHLLKKLDQELKQSENNLKEAERKINEELQAEQKINNEKIQSLKEKSVQYEFNIEDQQKKREESYKKMLEFVKQIKDGLDLSKGQETSIQCLHEAETALNNIEGIMRSASNFWKQIKIHCEKLTRHIVTREFKAIENTDSLTKQRMWNSETFKSAALQYSGQWQALNNTCTIASESITLVQDEINKYICENPTKEEAVKLVQQLASDMLSDSKSSENMVTDKPADN